MHIRMFLRALLIQGKPNSLFKGLLINPTKVQIASNMMYIKYFKYNCRRLHFKFEEGEEMIKPSFDE